METMTKCYGPKSIVFTDFILVSIFIISHQNISSPRAEISVLFTAVSPAPLGRVPGT